MKFFTFLRDKLTSWLLSERTTTLGDLFQNSNPESCKIYNGDELKFINVGTSDLLVKTDIGYSPISKVLQTVEYEEYKLTLESGAELICADEHIVINADGNECFVKDLKPGELISTSTGPTAVVSVTKTGSSSNMYDLQLDDDRHVYYTNNILSHNTTCAAMYILHMAIFSGSKKCIIASKNLKHATEIMKRIKFAYEELPSWMKPACKFYNRTSIEFMNGSEIKCEATSENTGRGDSPSILLVDECAFLPRRIQEEMWASLQPALSTGGKFIITSTPNGDDDLFASLWRGALSGANNFYPVHVLWNEHPERGDEYLREMFSNLGNLKCRQEVLCEFLSSESLLVDSVKLGSLKPEPFLWEHNACKFWVPKEEIGGRNKTYMVSLDPSAGGGADFSAIEVFEFPSMRQVAELRMNDLVPGIIYGRLKWMLTFLTTPKNGHSSSVYWTFERNSVGEAISALYWADENPIDAAELISDSPTKYGVYTTETAKIQFCLMLKRMIEKINGIVPKSSNIINELKHFASKGRSYAAKPGMTDDCVMAMVGIMRIITYISGSDEEAFRMVNEFIDPNEAMNKTESEQLVEALPIVF